MSRAKAPQQNQQQQQQQQQQQFAGMNHGGYLGMGGGMRNMGFPALGPESSMGNMAQGGAMRGVGAVGMGSMGGLGAIGAPGISELHGRQVLRSTVAIPQMYCGMLRGKCVRERVCV